MNMDWRLTAVRLTIHRHTADDVIARIFDSRKTHRKIAQEAITISAANPNVQVRLAALTGIAHPANNVASRNRCSYNEPVPIVVDSTAFFHVRIHMKNIQISVVDDDEVVSCASGRTRITLIVWITIVNELDDTSGHCPDWLIPAIIVRILLWIASSLQGAVVSISDTQIVGVSMLGRRVRSEVCRAYSIAPMPTQL